MNNKELYDKLTSIINNAVISQHVLSCTHAEHVIKCLATPLEQIFEDSQEIALTRCVEAPNPSGLPAVTYITLSEDIGGIQEPACDFLVY